jgi:hypothetical protein
MATPAEVQFGIQMVQAATVAGVQFPGYWAAEACLESWDWQKPTGCSDLAARAKNVFGLQVPRGWTGDTVQLWSSEYLNGALVPKLEPWPVFESYAAAFAERQRVLTDNPGYYADALAAETGVEFVRLVSGKWRDGSDALPVSDIHPCVTFPDGRVFQWDSGRWSTLPQRAVRVLQTYASHPEIFQV